MKILKISAVLLLAVAISSCCSCRSKSRAGGAMALAGSSWQATQIGGEAFTPGAENYMLTFGVDNRISGIGDCNRLMGGYTHDANGKLSFDGTAATRMFCSNQQDEDRFMKAIADVDGYSIDGNNLMLLNNGQVVMVLRKVN